MPATRASGADAFVVIVDDDAAFRTSLSRELDATGFRVAEASGGTELRSFLQNNEPDVILLDLMMPGEDGLTVLESLTAAGPGGPDVVILTGHGTLQTAVQALKLGAADYLQKPCDLDELEITLSRVLETRHLRERNVILERGLSQGKVELIGRSQRFLAALRDVQKAAASRANVLIWGESGTGKELVARKLHELSPVAERPLVMVDCASLNDELMHSELFGHERGAFSGAVARKHGLFEVADGGSLCLDEVGEVTPRVQAKLLRVLDGGSFRRVGGTREINVDVRVISATNRHLEDAVAAGGFREDLYYRLSMLKINVPPLRERADDIPLLAEYFLARLGRGRSQVPRLDPQALQALQAYDWPGNVRELAGTIERLVVFRPTSVIDGADVAELLHTRPARSSVAVGEDLPLAEVERRHIENVLRRCNGHRAEAARILDISERTLYRKLGEYRRREGRGDEDLEGGSALPARRIGESV